MSTTSVTTSTASGAYTETAGNTLLVLNGGSVSAATIDGGAFLTVSSGGQDYAATILAGGTETVSAHGSATGDQIYGTVSTVSGSVGTLTNETVHDGGTIDLYTSGTATSTTVLSSGTLIISGNATATNTVLSGGATVELDSPKATLAGSLTFSGGDNTLDVASTVTTSAGSFGDQAVISGFSSTDVIDVTVFTGASASFSTSGGNEVVTVSGGGSTEAFIFAGTSTYTSNTVAVVSSGSHEYIEYSASGFSSGGTTTSVTTSTASGAFTESSGQTLLVLNGGSVSAATIDNGGSLIVNGGADYAATVSSGATETVSAGSATGDQIYGGATVYADVTSETVENGGVLTINGGIGSSTTVLAGGTETVIGSASGDQIYGTLSTLSGVAATLTNETVFGGGEIVLSNATSATDTTVSSGGLLLISGKNTVNGTDVTTVSGGGTVEFDSPKASLDGSLIFAGGGNTLEINDTTSGGFGDMAVMSGFSSTDQIHITSAAYAGAALTLSQGVTSGNTVAEVLSAGTVVETFTFAGTALSGSLSLEGDGSGGVDLEITPMNVTTTVTTSTASGTYTEGATDTLLVLNGGSVSAATIDDGAFLVVNGGTDYAATILSGGTETVSAGTATGDLISGSAIVTGNGAVAGETVESSGTLTVNGTGSASDTSLSGGGVVDMASATATLSGTLTFAGGGNTLEATAIASSTYGDQAAISGFSSSDKIDVTGISPTGATLSFTTNGAGNEVVTISGTGGSESFVFSNPATYNSGTMSLIKDGNGGVDLILDTTPAVAFTSLGGESNAATQIVNGTVDTTVDPEAIGSTVSVTEGNTVVGTATVGANGYWSANVTFLNDDGANVLTASDTDAAGNTGVTSQSLTYNVNTTAAAFTPGNLVISISGDGDGSGVYGDNQASPITLEQITTSGTIVSQVVLPQTTTVVNGVTESAISGEYGSSSEGSLSLSADGHSLVIAGYGVNAQTFNAGGAAVYGSAALAQSTSIPGGQFTAVTRVIADINADGVVDTSTDLYNVFNLNNPRSVATVDGSSFYISGQGVSGDTTQGVFYATDGSSSATSINDATDTRAVEIYDGQLYVSANSKQGPAGGTTNISVYGSTLPTSATSPTILPGIDDSIVLTSATANTVNGSDIGSSVNLSPEDFFFANADTLYVADGGDPKEGGLGDGGLQKWVYNGTQWTLEYTLSSGLNLVPDTASSGTSGLIGLTGEVVGNSVELFATNETLTDLGQTYVYEITDSLSSTTGAGETFTQLLAASPGENIRGISFAPTGYVPTITTLVGQPVNGGSIEVQGTGQNGDTVTLYADGGSTPVGSGTVVNGSFDIVTSATFADGNHTLTATETDSQGVISAASGSFAVAVDPTAPAITTLVGQPVNGGSIEVQGTGQNGDIVTLYADGGSTPVGSGTVVNGSFDIVTSATFAAGGHVLTATETDSASLTSAASAAFDVTVGKLWVGPASQTAGVILGGAWSTAADWSGGLPGAADIAVLDSSTAAYMVDSMVATTIGGLVIAGAAGAATATLNIKAGTFSIEDAASNAGTIKIQGGAALDLLGTLTNSGALLAVASGANIDLDGGSITGGGERIVAGTTLEATGGSLGSTLSGGTVVDKGTLIATDNTTLTLSNTTVNAAGGGVIEAFDALQLAPSTLLLDDATIDSGTLTTADGGLIATVAGTEDTLDGSAISAGSNLTVVDDSTLALQGRVDNAGTLTLASTGDTTELVASATATKLTNTGTIAGGGQVGLGDGNLALTNSGTIDANGAAALVVDTGNALVNSGDLEADAGSGGLTIDDAVRNTATAASDGLFANGGNVTVEGAVSGGGAATIAGATLEFAAAANEAVTFTSAPGGVLALGTAQSFAGTVAGLASGDAIDLANFQFSGGASITRVGGTGAAGTTTNVTVQDGSLSVTLHLLNQFAGQFAVSKGAYTLTADSGASTAGTLVQLAAGH